MPISPVAECRVEPSSCDLAGQRPDSEREEQREREDDVECPSEKKNPTPSGRWPSFMSLRVVLSIAAMWSASKAWRSPRV